MSKTSIPNAPLPFDELAEAIKGRRSVYGLISGLRLDRAAPGEAWSSLPYRPVFVGDTETGVLHGGVVPPPLDESGGIGRPPPPPRTRALAPPAPRVGQTNTPPPARPNPPRPPSRASGRAPSSTRRESRLCCPGRPLCASPSRSP